MKQKVFVIVVFLNLVPLLLAIFRRLRLIELCSVMKQFYYCFALCDTLLLLGLEICREQYLWEQARYIRGLRLDLLGETTLVYMMIGDQQRVIWPDTQRKVMQSWVLLAGKVLVANFCSRQKFIWANGQSFTQELSFS